MHFVPAVLDILCHSPALLCHVDSYVVPYCTHFSPEWPRGIFFVSGKRLTLSSLKRNKAKLRPGKDPFLAVQIMQPFVGLEVHTLTFWASALDTDEWLVACRRSSIPVKCFLFSSNVTALETLQSIRNLERKEEFLPRMGTEPRFLVHRGVFFSPSVVQTLVYSSS